VKTLYTGNFDARGRRLDPRVLPRGSELSWAGVWIPSPRSSQDATGAQQSLGAWAYGDNAARWFSFPIGKGKPLDQVRLTLNEFRRMALSAKYYEPLNPNLRGFSQAGGKLMLYQGWEDWGVTPSQTLMYYDALRRAMGGQEQTDRFARLYMIPGMSHCGGGPSPNTSDMLLQMVRWVEDGQTPEFILVTDRNPATQSTRQRPIFHYPLVPRYIGPDPAQDPTGPDKPDNFAPAKPAKLRVDSIDWVGNSLLSPSTGQTAGTNVEIKRTGTAPRQSRQGRERSNQ
jgi:feruloyl esterase